MQLTPAQKTVFKSDRAANTATVQAAVAGQSDLQPVQIKDVADNGDNYQRIADWYNLVTAAYFVHRSNVTRAEVYKSTVSAGDSSSGSATVWSWQGYKAQSSPEQDAWKEMFMGGSSDFGNLNNRQGAADIFGTAGQSGANRTHIFNVAKRRCTNLEKLFVVAVLTPPANTGNVGGDARGLKTNPDQLVFEGLIGESDVRDAILNG